MSDAAENTSSEVSDDGSETLLVECEVIEVSDDDDEHPTKPQQSEMLITPPNPTQCEICAKVFKDKHQCKKHMFIHTGQKPFMCNGCGKTFRYKHSLKAHELVHQGPDAGRDYICTICAAAFKRNYTLRIHMRIHTGEKKYACHLCDKAFVQSNNLKQHIKAHLNEKDFACDQCDKRFMTASKLKRHYQRHIRKKLKDQGLFIQKPRGRHAAKNIEVEDTASSGNEMPVSTVRNNDRPWDNRSSTIKEESNSD